MKLRIALVPALLPRLQASALAADKTADKVVKRGEYVAKTGGCSDCQGRARQGAGLPAAFEVKLAQ